MSQQNQSTLQSAINTQLADNTSGAISAADVRDNLINMTDSLLFNSGSQGITGSLTATSFTGSLEGTATTASYVETAQTASYVLNAVSASRAATASISTFANSSNNILHADLNSNGDYAITFTSGIGYATVLCRLNQATGLSPFTYNPSTSLLKITGSIIATGGFTGSLLGTATTASYAATASKVSITNTAADTNLLLTLTDGNSLLKDQYNSITYNTANNILNIVAYTNFTGSVSSQDGFTGSLQGTATAAVSASYAATASVLLGSVTSASYAATASYVDPLIQSTTITGSLTVTQIDPLLYFAANHTTRLFKNFTSADCAFSLASGGTFNPGIYRYSNSIVLPWDKKIQSYSIYNNILSSSALSTVISLPPIYNAGYSVGETISVYNLSATSPSIKDSGSFYVVASMQGVTSVFSNQVNGTFSTAYILSGSWGNYTNITLTDSPTTASIKVNPGQKAIFEVAYWGTNSPSPSSSIAGFSFDGYYTNDSNATTTTNCYYLFRGIENL
jgi:hypothetical protein